jgi:hypothetical protein
MFSMGIRIYVMFVDKWIRNSSNSARCSDTQLRLAFLGLARGDPFVWSPELYQQPAHPAKN